MASSKYTTFGFLFIFLITLVACSEQEIPTSKQELQLTGHTMGPIVYTVKIYGKKNELESSALADKVDQLLKSINATMSTYDKQSELSKFNQSNAHLPHLLSNDLQQVIKESIRLAELSDGAFDVTVGPLVNLWSFGPEKRANKIPSEQQIANAKQYIGIDKIGFTDGKLSKSDDNVYVDLSAIAKGYAVDKVAELIEQFGYHDYLVDIGGEMRVKGKKANGDDWIIAVEKPISGTRAVQKVIIVGDNAVATSGDYRNYFEEDGVRYSHTIDPKTGWPINHKLVSVTVVHPSSMTADGLATAIEVMGPEQGLAFAKANNLAVYLISKNNQEFVERATESFTKLIVQK